MTTLTIAQLGPYLDRYRARLFRMETLSAYATTSDGDDFRRWLAGETEPTWERKHRWMDTLRAERAAGKVTARVRVLSEELTEYERYSCEWGYALNAEAGEDIRVLHRGEHDLPPGLRIEDYWLLDDDEAVLMHYDSSGAFIAAEPIPSPTLYVEDRDAAWVAAEPFTEWWTRHPGLHRRLAV